MEKRWMNSRWAVIFVGWIAFGLRIFNLNGRPPWYDESFTILYTERLFSVLLHDTSLAIENIASEVHPLFYYALLNCWTAVLGQSLFAVRLLSVMFSLLTVYVSYAVAKYLFGQRVGLVTAVIITLSPFSIYYAQEARMYALLGLMAMSATYFFVRAWQEGKRRFWVGFGISAALTIYSHNLGLLYIVGFDLWVLYQWVRQKKVTHFSSLLLAHLVMFIVYAPWLVILLQQVDKLQQGYWITRPTILTLLQTTLIFHFAYDNQPLPTYLLPFAFLFAVLLPILLWLDLRRKDLEIETTFSGSRSFLLFLTLAPPLLALLISQFKPIYIIRPLLPSAQIYYLLIALVFVVGKMPRPIKIGVFSAMAIVTILSIYNHYTYTSFPRAPYAEIVTYLQEEMGGDASAMVVHNNKFSYFSTYYYGRDLPQRFIADAEGSGADTLADETQAVLSMFATDDIKTAVSPYDHIWYIHLSSNTNEDAPLPTDVQWLSTRFTSTGSRQFQNITIYTFERDE